MKNAKLYASFSSWQGKVAQVVRMRRFMRRMKNAGMYRCFAVWQATVEAAKKDRRQREASVMLQSFYRGRASARKTAKFKRERGAAATRIQATFRGKADRDFCDNRRRKVAREKRHEKRHARSQKRREQMEMCDKKEQARLDKERKFVLSACAQAEKDFADHVAAGQGRRDLAAKRDAIVNSSRESYERINSADAEATARATMLRQRLDTAKRAAIVDFRARNPVTPLGELTPNVRAYVEANGHLADVGIISEVKDKGGVDARGDEQVEASKRLEARRRQLGAFCVPCLVTSHHFLSSLLISSDFHHFNTQRPSLQGLRQS